MVVRHVVEAQKVQCGVAGMPECGRGDRGGQAWPTSVVWTLAGVRMQVIGCPNVEI